MKSARMIIWLFDAYGPIPGEGWRDYCYTMMGQALAAAGHEVIWWTSNFSHHFKRFRSDGWADIAVSERFCIRLVPTSGYRKNIGVGRVWRDLVFAGRAHRYGKSLAAPDCIISSESPLTFGFAGPALAKWHDCALVHHQMDLWPELIVKSLPAPLRGIAELLFWPVYRSRRRVYAQLSAATGLARSYLEGVLSESRHLRSRPHAVIYNGINVESFRAAMNAAPEMTGRLPGKKHGDIWAIFAGSLGPSYDVPTLCLAGRLLEASSLNIHILIAGDGPCREEVAAAASQCSRLHYLGKLPPESLAALYRCCDIGLCAYSDRSNVEMPDKIYDYMAAGLPVINSLPGEVRELISERQIGLQYRAGDAADLVRKLTLLNGGHAMRQFGANSFEAGTEFDASVQYTKMVGIVSSITPRATSVRPEAYDHEVAR